MPPYPDTLLGNENTRGRGEYSGLGVEPLLDRGEVDKCPTSPSSGKQAIFGLKRAGDVFGLSLRVGSNGMDPRRSSRR